MVTQCLPASLTPLEAAVAVLLHELEAVTPEDLPLAEALGCVAAEMPALPSTPVYDLAAADGWAVNANDVVGVSSYSPLALARPPTWVNVGDAMPQHCDCVLDVDAVDTSGPIVEIIVEGAPGQGIRRAGSDIAADRPAIASGHLICPRDLLTARTAGLETLNVRRPRLRIVNLPGGTATAHLIADHARANGARVTEIEAEARDAASIADVLDPVGADLLIVVGGSGVGRNDATVTALARRGEVLAHGVALQPGRTVAIGRADAVPVLVMPGAPDHALAVWFALALPALECLSGRRSRESRLLPLSRKIASSVGLAEIALLEERNDAWLPLATGDLPLHAMARADAWLLIPGSSEGFAAGTPIDAYLWRE
ncbi:molybdopterin-binding protein [Nitrobacter sp. JJSN]|uniref:molybdopterin-binding protein n=1 Tax=Nitrobacter sp. JJSN TaxID=3453033 RepID=UPI003F763647